MGSLWIVVGHCGSLWVVPGFSNYVCLPYISCNGTCLVHNIFRLDAIERYVVTIYHIVAKNGFPK